LQNRQAVVRDVIKDNRFGIFWCTYQHVLLCKSVVSSIICHIEK